MSEKRTRKEEFYRDTNSKDGGISPKFGKVTADRVIRYCKATNQNKTRFMEKCVNERLDVLEMELYENMTREELIAMIMAK